MERQLSEQEQVRRDKLEEIRNYCNPYPDRFDRTHTLKEARNLEDGTTDVNIAGRIIFMRKIVKLHIKIHIIVKNVLMIVMVLALVQLTLKTV